MIWLAWRNSLLRPGRTLLIILAVAAILAEILALEGFLAGSYWQLRQAVLQRGEDIIVAQSGVTNFFATRSILPQQARRDIEALDGVVTTHPLTALAVIYESGDKRSPLIVLAYDDAGGPRQIEAGHRPSATGDIVVDLSLAKKFSLALGDRLTLSDYDFTIVGFARAETALFTPFAFTNFDTLIDFYFDSDLASDIAAFPLLSFLAVDITPNIASRDMAARISAEVEGVTAVPIENMARHDEKLGQELLGPILNLLLGLSYGVGALAVGLFAFAAVRGRRKSFGVLRALGFSAFDIGLSITVEAVAWAIVAIPVSLLLAVGLATLIETLAPGYLLLVTETRAVIQTALIAIILGVLGALLPLRMLMRLDPASAFKD
jgi:putative ABC transport system permease protein